jgi:crotonobetainyl-CoA:carnitine CoA-transferase CaiB-like acyl-CoA transferase
MVTTVEQPGVGPVRQVATPFVFDGVRPNRVEPAPKYGEHTDEILRGLGYDESLIAELRESGTIAGQ